jgi:hypothetical protein
MVVRGRNDQDLGTPFAGLDKPQPLPVTCVEEATVDLTYPFPAA